MICIYSKSSVPLLLHNKLSNSYCCDYRLPAARPELSNPALLGTWVGVDHVKFQGSTLWLGALQVTWQRSSRVSIQIYACLTPEAVFFWYGKFSGVDILKSIWMIREIEPSSWRTSSLLRGHTFHHWAVSVRSADLGRVVCTVLSYVLCSLRWILHGVLVLPSDRTKDSWPTKDSFVILLLPLLIAETSMVVSAGCWWITVSLSE